MKTVSSSFLGVDEHLHFTGESRREDLGNCHVDQCVRYLLGLPHADASSGDDACPPTLVLEGRSGMRMELCRRERGATFHLTVKDGEQDQPIDEMQAVYRVRLFVEYHGEHTEHTEEIRLPPELRALIRDEEAGLDEERQRRLGREAPRRVFRQRGSLRRLFKKHTLVVDRLANAVFERRRGKDHEIVDLSTVRKADVADIAKEGDCQVVVEHSDASAEAPVGKTRWALETAAEIAEAINDAIDLPEAKRKILHYRRAARGRERAKRAGSG